MRNASLLLTVFGLLAFQSVAADRTANSGGGPALPNVALRTQDNQPVRFYEDLIKGKTVVISFLFTSCKAICPRTTANLLKVQKALGDHVGRDVFFYSLTLDPKTDTPEVLHKYAKTIGAKPGWTFLTGKSEDLELLRRKLGLYDPDPKVDADKTQHGAVIVYGNDADGRWSMMAALADSDRIADAVRRVMGSGVPPPAVRR
jgi:protein SCO1